jgi:hypothetical protein
MIHSNRQLSFRNIERRGNRYQPTGASQFILHPSTFILLIAVAAYLAIAPASSTQSGQTGSGAHGASASDSFTRADRLLVERAIGAACSERARDPHGSVPIDEMQARVSLPTSDPDSIAGTRRAEHLLPVARELVVLSLIQLAKNYDLYRNSAEQARIGAAVARVQTVAVIKPDVDARDNASVFLHHPRTIRFGTIFLAGLRSDEAMTSVLAHELTHIADGRQNSLHNLFRAIGLRAASRTGLRINGQRAEELACDLVGVMAVEAFIKQTPNGGEPLARKLARAVEHNCVDRDDSDEDHLSPGNTIRALLSLDLPLARGLLGDSVMLPGR